MLRFISQGLQTMESSFSQFQQDLVPRHTSPKESNFLNANKQKIIILPRNSSREISAPLEYGQY